MRENLCICGEYMFAYLLIAMCYVTTVLRTYMLARWVRQISAFILHALSRLVEKRRLKRFLSKWQNCK